jgi:hypothetical protein
MAAAARAAASYKEANIVRLYIFKSESGALRAFAGDLDTRVLPSQHGPWHPIGVVGPDTEPPHNLKREAIERAIANQGFQLFRLKKDRTAA